MLRLFTTKILLGSPAKRLVPFHLRFQPQSTFSTPGPFIPMPPEPQPVQPDTSIINVLGEETIQSLGLGGFTPAALYRQLVESVHVYGLIPWWESIIICTIILRLVMLPVTIFQHKFLGEVSIRASKIQECTRRMEEARIVNDEIELYKANLEFQKITKDFKFSHFLSILIPAPVFLSVYYGLIKMTKLPVESLKYGGPQFFPDLTTYDPYFILPSVLCGLVLLQFLMGQLLAQSKVTQMMRVLCLAAPPIVFFFIMKIPAALLIHWSSSALFGIFQTVLLTHPKIKSVFKIKSALNNSSDAAGVSSGNFFKEFVENFKSSLKNAEKLKTIQGRLRQDEENFRTQGTMPIRKTYFRDPTKGGRK